MSDEFEVRDENGEVLEVLTEEEQESTEGGAAYCATCRDNSCTLTCGKTGGLISNIRILSNPVGATYSFGSSGVTVRRTPGRKGLFRMSCRMDTLGTVTFQVKFI